MNRKEEATRLIHQCVTIKCRKCKGSMINVVDLSDSTIVGYSCENCPHYYLFD